MSAELICIACPIGCRLTVATSPGGDKSAEYGGDDKSAEYGGDDKSAEYGGDDKSAEYGGDIEVSGNRCPRGETYGREEVLAPRRIVTAVVPTSSQAFPCAPVRTEQPLARGLIPELLKHLYSRTATLPVRQGAVFIEDFHGARVVFTRTLPPDEVPPVGEPGAESER